MGKPVRIRPWTGLLALVGVAGFLSLAAVLVGRELSPGPPLASGQPAHCIVRLGDPVAGLVSVQILVPAEALAGRRHLDLLYLDARHRPQALRSVSATSGGRSLRVTRPFWKGRHERRVELDRSAAPLLIEYTIDPTFYPPGAEITHPADARSRVTPELAILRTASVFPVILPSGLTARVSFVLPTGWVAVTPWKAEGEGFLVCAAEQTQVEYIGLGPFDVREVETGDITVRVASLAGQTDLPAETVASLLRFEVNLVGAPMPATGGTLAVIVAPDGFTRGGAAGTHTIVQPPSANVLAHEMLHWWNRSSLVRPEAEWFHEGVTEYYGMKVARETGVWPAERCQECLADLNGEMRYLERDKPRSLESVSRQARSDSGSRRLVYSKGALFALLLDRQLQAHGRSLDEAVRAVLTGGRQGLGNGELKAIFHQVYGGLVDAAFDAHVLDDQALPDLRLDPANGRSGCARYLPDR